MLKAPNRIITNAQTFTWARLITAWLFYGIFMAFMGCLALSCKNSHPQNMPTNGLAGYPMASIDSLKTAHYIDSADYASLFKNKTNGWLYKMLMNKQNKWANFSLLEFWHKDSLKQYTFKQDTSFYKQYAMFLDWSPDSTYILDYGSYGVEMGKRNNGKYYVKSNDVDQEIALIDFKAKTVARLLFFGPGTSAWGAHWVDSTQVALLGQYSPDTNKHPDTLLWILNVKDKLFRKYKYRQKQT